MLQRFIALSCISCVLSAACSVSDASAAEAGIASGTIFGIQIGQPIALTGEEQKMVERDHLGTFVRHKAEKPDDVQYLQIYATPITRIVTEVDGASEFRNKASADAYAAKYVKLLSAAHPEFRAAAPPSQDTPLDIETDDWRLTIRMTDLKATYGRAGGYVVRMSLKPAVDSALGRLDLKAHEEREELDRRDRRRSESGTRARPADLKGLQ